MFFIPSAGGFLLGLVTECTSPTLVEPLNQRRAFRKHEVLDSLLTFMSKAGSCTLVRIKRVG